MTDRPTTMRCQATALMMPATKQALVDMAEDHETSQGVVLTGGFLNMTTLPREAQAAWIEMAKQVFLEGT